MSEADIFLNTFNQQFFRSLLDMRFVVIKVFEMRNDEE